MISSKGIIEAVLRDCMALLQNISSIYVVSRSWNLIVKTVALSLDYLDPNPGTTISWLYDLG